MSKAAQESLRGQFTFSGRSIGRGLRKRRGGGNPSSERRGLRRKFQAKPCGQERFPEGFRYRAMGKLVDTGDGKTKYVDSPVVYPGC